MVFTRGTFVVGDGRLSGAVEKDGAIHFFIDIDGAIVKRTMQIGSRGVSAQEFVSYADEYTHTPQTRVSMWGNEVTIENLA